MTELVVTVGLPASGKTSWAKEWVAQDVRNRARVERDQLRAMMHDSIWKGHHTEDKIVLAQRSMTKELLRHGVSVVVSDTNLHPDVMESWKDLAKAVGVPVRVVDFLDVPLETCLKRNAQRAGTERISEDTILSMYNRYIKKRWG
jgi:predicted kinase